MLVMEENGLRVGKLVCLGRKSVENNKWLGLVE